MFLFLIEKNIIPFNLLNPYFFNKKFEAKKLGIKQLYI